MSTRIAFRETRGKGRAVVLVHGNSGSSRWFEHQVASPLGQRCRLVAIDLPGHGDSAPAADGNATYAVGGYARVVADLVARLDLAAPILVGISLGGHVVIEASPLLPHAAGFVISGTPPLSSPADLASAFLPNPALAFAFRGALTEDEMKTYVGALLRAGADIPQALVEDVRRTDPAAREALGASVAAGRFADERKLVAELRQPLAVLHGSQDAFVSVDYLRGVAMPSLWRGAVQSVEGAGHAAQWDVPERFNALLESFVADIGVK